MAAKTKATTTKSQAIRNYFKKNPKALAKDVIPALAKDGFAVTESHVYGIKGKMKLTQRRKAKAVAASKNGSAAKLKASASKDAPSNSQIIREFLTDNPKASVDEIISTLAAKGTTVKKGLVYFVKGSMKSKKRRAKEKVAKAMVTTTASSNGNAVDALATIKQIKGLAAELGGLKSLKALVDALSD
jgi:hypothetical protein